MPSSPRGSQGDISRSSPASSPHRPPLPPRPISPMLRTANAAKQVSPPHPESAGRDAPPSIPARPVARAVEEALLEYAQSTAQLSLTNLHEPAGAEDRFAGLRREKLYSPDNVSTNRRLPVAEGLPNSDLYLKHSTKCFAVSGFYTCTGGEKIRVWYIPSGENIKTVSVGESKIYAMAFVPTHYMEDEGRYLWVSLDKGEIIEVDITTGEIVDRKTVHSGTVTHIMRHHGHMWTVDDNGGLKIWAQDSTRKRVTLQQRPRAVRVGVKQNVAFVVNCYLWSAAGKVIEVYRPVEEGAPCIQQRFDLTITVGIGNVAGFASTRKGDTVFSGHDDGKILVWDATTLAKKRIVNAGMYPVTALLGLGDKYLWAGHSTGKIHIYDVEHIDGDWSALKEFQAYHSASVDELVMDERSVFLSGRLQVASLSHNGQIRIWDGFLSRDWLENQLRLREHECCTYRDLKLLICSWNLDASKPAELEESRQPENVGFLKRWLSAEDQPDIIVVGFQELVDLESKKVTAKQLLKGTKKSQQSHLDHRFKLWREALIKAVKDAQPKLAYRLLECRQLVGLFQCVFIKESEGARLKDVAVDMVKTGLKGYHGNKGGIATRFVLDDSSFCFVNCHLAAHQNQISARNNDVATILKDAHFPPRPAYEGIFIGGGDGSMVLDHENVFWSGDLNYRIDMARERVIELVAQQDWATLQEHDQLLHQMMINPSFGLRGFVERPLDFAPTFKYDVGTDRYDSSEKRRVPSWCDRVLYCSHHVVQTSYVRYETCLSDHRPISATFTARVKSVNATLFRPVKQDVENRLQGYLAQEIEAQKVSWLVGRSCCNEEDARRVLSECQGDLRVARDRLGENGGLFQQADATHVV
ncbi:Endonuclease/exonuclease/phosphatase [Powellomyces hirtus]|nr:Endonuclease/exonuclease/phosphatase [Powellomyces hirtus]